MANEKLEELRRTWREIDDSFEIVLEKCNTADEKQRWRTVHNNAHIALLKAIADGLESNDSVVQEIYDDLKSANDALVDAKNDLDNIAKLLTVAAAAVKLAGSLATLAVV